VVPRKAAAFRPKRGRKGCFYFPENRLILEDFDYEGRSNMYRSAYCGALREAQVGERVTVCGWVCHKRDMGGVIFLDLRDCKGTLQVVCNAGLLSAEDFTLAENVRLESVMRFEGKLRIRDEETYNPRLETGTIELAADGAQLLSEADPLPI
jgi:aspartyl-tRNA synthetase